MDKNSTKVTRPKIEFKPLSRMAMDQTSPLVGTQTQTKPSRTATLFHRLRLIQVRLAQLIVVHLG